VSAAGARGRVASILDRDWLFALSLALAVGVVVWFGRSVRDFFNPTVTDVLVPSLSGQSVGDATSEAERLKLKAIVIANQPSDRYPKDVVMGQQPVAGTHVREGRQLSLIVSTGVTIFPMPDLRYQSLREAQLVLGASKLPIAKTTIVPNDDVQAMHILAQDPPPLTSVREGTRVTLELSKGPPSSVRVPNFVGELIDDARSAASDAKVHLGQIVWTPFGASGPARGVVVRQNPAANALIDPFAPVSLQVSAGPGVYGYLLRQVHAQVTVPAHDPSANVRVEVRDETGTWNVFDAYAQARQRLDFNLTVVGTSEIDTYVNNELLNQTVLGKEPPLATPSPGGQMPTPVPTAKPAPTAKATP
jgi:serine/threonine-protein kinase